MIIIFILNSCFFILFIILYMLYNSNFDDSEFQDVKKREFNRTIDDPCAIQQRNGDNGKKLKFVTTNHIDLIEAKDKLNFYGMTIRDQLFVPAESMDSDSFLRYGKTGGVLTNCNIKNEYGQLPMSTIPGKYQTAHGNLEVEDAFRVPLLETNKHSCNPRDNNYHSRSFYLFNDKIGIDTPNALKSIEPQEFGPRGGVSSRFIKKKK